MIAYEERAASVHQKLQGGYPRFVIPPLVQQLQNWVAQKHDVAAEYLSVVSSEASVTHLKDFVARQKIDQGFTSFQIEEQLWAVTCNPANGRLQATVRAFLQHTGCQISSRQAESFLLQQGEVASPEIESRSSNSDARDSIIQILAEVHNQADVSDIYLGSSGMNCFFAAFRALQEIQRQQNRRIWIQLGWLYLDSIELIRKYAAHPDEYIHIQSVHDLDQLEQLLSTYPGQIAGVITEAPTNPLIQMCDLPRLADLCDQYEAALILDPTIASPANIYCLKYADVIVNSLTKYAAHQGDVMMGSLVLNPNSKWYQSLRNTLNQYLIEPYQADIERMACQIVDYKNILKIINTNQKAVCQYLERHPKIKTVHHAYSQSSAANYAQVLKKDGGAGCLLSFEVAGSMPDFYDNLAMAKGPSFGLQFSILCPFIYLAHYDLVQSPAGQKQLAQNGLNPELIRFSVGCEQIDDICQNLEQALHYA